MTNVSDLFVAGIEEVRKTWGWFLVFGILLMALGGVCVVKAQTATTFSILAWAGSWYSAQLCGS